LQAKKSECSGKKASGRHTGQKLPVRDEHLNERSTVGIYTNKYGDFPKGEQHSQVDILLLKWLFWKKPGEASSEVHLPVSFLISNPLTRMFNRSTGDLSEFFGVVSGTKGESRDIAPLCFWARVANPHTDKELIVSRCEWITQWAARPECS
jgi:hypothetical protein